MVNTCYDSYSVLVVLFRIIHTLLPSLPPSLPVQFGTAFVFCSRIPYSVLGRLLSPSHGLARLSYSIFVFRILYWVDPSLPVQFGTGFVFCIRIPYSVLGRPLSLSRTQGGSCRRLTVDFHYLISSFSAAWLLRTARISSVWLLYCDERKVNFAFTFRFRKGPYAVCNLSLPVRPVLDP